MYVTGTKSKELLAYIDRVSAYLGLDDGIDINLVSTCAGMAGGFCDGDEEWINVEIARNDAAGRIPTKQLKINIAHELVHASQIQTGRLINSGFAMRTNAAGEKYLNYTWTWEGNVYEDIAYDEHPWEIEAYGREMEVYEACV